MRTPPSPEELAAIAVAVAIARAHAATGEARAAPQRSRWQTTARLEARSTSLPPAWND